MVTAIAFLVGLASLVCFVLVLIQMFQRGQTGLGIACIVLLFVCGIGGLIAFIYGWVKAREWNIQNIMIAWTVCVLIQLVLIPMGGFTTFQVQLPGR